MKKFLICLSILVCLLGMGLWVAFHPYETHIEEPQYAPDLVFENDSKITDARIRVDFSKNPENKEEVNANVSMHLTCSNINVNAAILPFYGSLLDSRNVNINLNGKSIDYAIQYGSLDSDSIIERLSYDDLIGKIDDQSSTNNDNRLILYTFDLPAGTTAIDITYTTCCGKNNTFNPVQYDFSFKIRKNNYKDTTHFVVQYVLNDKDKYINSTSQKNLILKDSIYEEVSSQNPLEIKVSISESKDPSRSKDFISMEISGYLTYLVIPLLVLIWIAFVLVIGYEQYQRYKKNKGENEVR